MSPSALLHAGQPLYRLSAKEYVVEKRILETHDPDGRHFDCNHLLTLIENIVDHALVSEVPMANTDAVFVYNAHKEEIFGVQESLGHTIYKISSESLKSPITWQITYMCSGKGDQHAITMTLFDTLAKYSWEAKVVLVLAAFVMNNAELLLVTQLCTINPLARTIALLKQLPRNMQDIEALKPRLKAVRSLVKAMVEVTKCIIRFEGLFIQYLILNSTDATTARILIHIAIYWVIKSVVACTLQMTELIAINREQVETTKVGMAWELWSFISKMSNLHGHLRKQLDVSDQHIEAQVQQKLLHLFEETHADNQEVLSTLFSAKDDWPLCDGFSQEKVDIEALRNKEVILLFSKLDISQGKLLFLLQQTYGHPHQKLPESCEIVWVALPKSMSWTHSEKKAFNQLATSLPWYSVSQPWLLRRAVVDYITKVWHFDDDLLMVVLDQKGKVTCQNAVDMVLIWGPMAYPFSASREEQLWEEASWTLELLMGEIDPLTSMWIGEGRTICLYGSSNLKWIREFTSKIKDITSFGVSLELVYVGATTTNDYVKEISTIITGERLSRCLSQNRICFFWVRLESVKRSRSRLGKDPKTDVIMKEVVSMLSQDATEIGWAVIAKGSSTDIIQLQGGLFIECLALLHVWGENIDKLGFLNAIRNALEPLPPVKHCHQSRIIPYQTGSADGTFICKECRRPMEKCTLYQCLME